jgi:tetratricopeptide (TPR) repeat protein
MLDQSPTPEVYRGLFELRRQWNEVQSVLKQLDDALHKASGDAEEEKNAANEPGQEARREEAQRAAVHARAMLIVLRDDAKLVDLLLKEAMRMLPVRRGGSGLSQATRLTLAKLAARTRQLQAAEDLYRSCLNELTFRRRRSSEHEIYLGLLTVLSLAHKNKEIIRTCEAGLQTAKVTNRVLFHFEAARAHMALGHVAEALEAIDAAVKNAGGREMALTCRINRAALLSEAGKHEEGAAECRQLLQEYNQPGDVHSIRSVLSSIHSAAHQYEEAEKQLQLILQNDPDNATANNDLGYLWADQNKKLDEAETRIRRALELDRRQRQNGQNKNVGPDGDRDNAAYVDSLGWVLFRKGDWTAARRELQRAAALPQGEDDPVVWDHLGDVLFRLKEIGEAGKAWKKAIELYETGGRRRPDERYREIKEKLRQRP